VSAGSVYTQGVLFRRRIPGVVGDSSPAVSAATFPPALGRSRPVSLNRWDLDARREIYTPDVTANAAGLWPTAG
jgi:hypothetical protein